MRSKKTTRKYETWHRALAAPYDQNSAYLLGFIAGDGSVTCHSLRIFLSTKDEDFLRQLRDALMTESPVKCYSNAEQNAHASGIEIFSYDMVEDLNAVGITRNKSKTYNPRKALSKIPKELHRHFFRGMVDADGCVAIYHDKDCYFNITGTEMTCRAFMKFAKSVGVKSEAKPRKTRDSYSYTVTSLMDVAILSQVLYDGANLYLRRKQAVAMRMIRKYRKKHGR